MRKLWFVSAVVVSAAGGLAWWLLREPDVGALTATPDDPTAQLDRPFIHTPDGEEAVDAGVGRVSGRVVTQDAAPVKGARVRLYAHSPELEDLECAVCHLAVLDCEDPSTVKRVIKGLREGTLLPPPVLAEVFTDADGHFDFEDAPLSGEVVAESAQLSAEAACDSEPMELMLEAPLTQEVHVSDFEGKPVSAARITLYSPRDGTLVQAGVDGQGSVTLASLDPPASRR